MKRWLRSGRPSGTSRGCTAGESSYSLPAWTPHPYHDLSGLSPFPSNFDFRAPENYIFVPDWMMKALQLRPRDVVSLKYVKLEGKAGRPGKTLGATAPRL